MVDYFLIGILLGIINIMGFLVLYLLCIDTIKRLKRSQYKTMLVYHIGMLSVGVLVIIGINYGLVVYGEHSLTIFIK